ncbi:hypothetical protein [Arenibaculum pallidiluteum]|uniref:hypothetical protein n=1 Tax=Arenibaculum pallidiluteum TaxID=2812559 RepID=UPI001A97C541|nr:hypothetical protein [Arenibaculum pallidiluteum]
MPLSPASPHLRWNAVKGWAAATLLFLAAVTFCFFALYYEQLMHKGFIIDDAYISLRHAKNFVLGHGFNFNADERVEGYTNFLWTLLMTPPLYFGYPAEPLVKVLGILSAVGIIVAVFLLARHTVGTLPGILLAAALALDPRLAVLSTWGLEITFYPMLYGFAIYALLTGRTVLAALLFAGACMTRIEGVLLVGLSALYLLWSDRHLAPSSGWLELRTLMPWTRRFLVFSGVFAAIFGTYFALRWAYYGYMLPNTFYAKVGTPWNSAARGLKYIHEMLSRMGLFGVVMLALALAAGIGVWLLVRAIRRHRQALAIEPLAADQKERDRLLLIAMLFVYLAYTVAVGGDHFGERFIYHALVIVLVGTVVALSFAVDQAARALSSRHQGIQAARPVLRTTIASVVAAVVLHGLATHPHRFGDMPGLIGWASLGVYLKNNAPQGASVATDAAGAIPYFSELPSIDTLGLGDIHIAHKKVPNLGRGAAGHEKGDPQYVLDRKPTYFASWVGPSGEMGRDYNRFFDYRTNYAFEGLVDMGRWDLNGNRVHLAPAGATEDEIRAFIKRLAPEGSPFGLAKRLPAARPEVSLRHSDLRSRLVDPLPILPDAILVAKAGHQPTHVLFGPYFRFGPGSYEWKVTLSFANVPSEPTQLCQFEALSGSGRGEAVTYSAPLNSVEAAERAEIVLSHTFTIAGEATDADQNIRLWCEGKADLVVRSVVVSRK